MSFESNVSIPRTPGTPKNYEKSSNGEASKIGSPKVFGPSEGHLNRNKGNDEPNDNKTKRVKDLPRREYGKIRDKHLPLDLNDPILVAAANTFARAVEMSNNKISSTSRANIMVKESHERGRPEVRCSGSINSIRAYAQR